METKLGIDLIGAAIGCGAQDEGCRDGARALFGGSLPDQLNMHFDQVRLAAWIETPSRAGATREERLGLIPTIADFNRKLAMTTARSIYANRFPLVFGGDHSCAIGTWSGVAQALGGAGNLGLIWIDAHMDSHTSLTSTSGAVHGMPLAALLGKGAESLVQVESALPKFLPQNVVLVGIRSYELGERQNLEAMGIRVVYMEEVRARGLRTVMLEAIEMVAKGTKAYGITLDMDAIDPFDAPGVGSPEAGGIGGKDCVEVLAECALDPRLCAFEIAEFNPYRDREHLTENLAIEIIDRVLRSVRESPPSTLC